MEKEVCSKYYPQKMMPKKHQVERVLCELCSAIESGDRMEFAPGSGSGEERKSLGGEIIFVVMGDFAEDVMQAEPFEEAGELSG
jgi:hypothetical protein